jgi:hypothetical protein
MADIFLSYNEKDREQARRVATLLAEVGWSVWWDRRIPAGESWRSMLEEALEGMRCMIVLWTAHSIESDWVFEEASEGRRQDKLIPVMLEAVRPPPGFREIQAADLTGWDGTAEFEGWRLLLADLENMLGPPPAAIPKIATPPGPSTADAARTTTGPSDNGSTPTVWPMRRMAIALLSLIAISGIAYVTLKPSPPVIVKPAYPPGTTVATVPATETTKPVQHALPKLPAVEPTKAPDPVIVATPTPNPTKATTTSTTSRPSITTAAKRNSARCADLLSRMQLGESLSDEAQALLQKECK